MALKSAARACLRAACVFKVAAQACCSAGRALKNARALGDAGRDSLYPQEVCHSRVCRRVSAAAHARGVALNARGAQDPHTPRLARWWTERGPWKIAHAAHRAGAGTAPQRRSGCGVSSLLRRRLCCSACSWPCISLCNSIATCRPSVSSAVRRPCSTS